MGNIFWVLCALLSGMVLPVQAGLNAQLGKVLENPILAALVSFGVGTVALVLYGLLTGVRWSSISLGFQAPWWLWIGGTMGAFYVAAAVVLAPRLGIGTMIALVVAGQMLASLFIDHHGYLGIPQHSFTVLRLVGVLLLLSGVVLIRNF